MRFGTTASASHIAVDVRIGVDGERSRFQNGISSRGRIEQRYGEPVGDLRADVPRNRQRLAVGSSELQHVPKEPHERRVRVSQLRGGLTSLPGERRPAYGS